GRAVEGNMEESLTGHTHAVQGLADPAGELGATHAGRERLLTDYHSIYEGFITLFIANADGTILDLVPPPDAGTLTPPIADRQYFVDAIQTRALTISDVIIGRRSHVPIVTIAAPLVASDGRGAGVAGAPLHLAEVQRSV